MTIILKLASINDFCVCKRQETNEKKKFFLFDLECS